MDTSPEGLLPPINSRLTPIFQLVKVERYPLLKLDTSIDINVIVLHLSPAICPVRHFLIVFFRIQLRLRVGEGVLSLLTVFVEHFVQVGLGHIHKVTDVVLRITARLRSAQWASVAAHNLQVLRLLHPWSAHGRYVRSLA